MLKLAPYFAGGLATLVVMDFLPLPVTTAIDLARDAAAVSGAAIAATPVDRSRKSDRLPVARLAAGAAPVISAVELVGLRDAAIVYRDRDGRVLFKTDPLSNATLIAKDVALPEVTIRDSNSTAVKPVPVETAQKPAGRGARDSKVPLGCDPAFSPLVGSGSANFAGRCLADNDADASGALRQLA